MICDGLVDDVPTSQILPGRDVPGASDSITELVVVPVRSQSVEGVLVAARSTMSPRFLPVDGDVAHEFASAIAITLELIATNAQVEQLRSMADHDRIARDLHDTVIQRLFAIAMRLESAVSGSSGVAAERMGDAVDALDEVIREIRSTIFDLRRPHAAERGLRAAVAAEIDRVADLLGFAPSLRFVGPIDASVTDEAARRSGGGRPRVALERRAPRRRIRRRRHRPHRRAIDVGDRRGRRRRHVRQQATTATGYRT